MLQTKIASDKNEITSRMSFSTRNFKTAEALSSLFKASLLLFI